MKFMNTVKDQSILITGSTDGIGKLTALKLAKQNAHVLIHGRNKEKVKRVVDEIKKESGNQNIEGLTADFSSLAEVRKLGGEVISKYKKIDVLINNAGVGYSDPRYSKDGYELRFAVNYLAPFLFTQLLLPSLRNAAKVPGRKETARIVNVSSIGQLPINFEDIMFEKKFDGVQAYRQSKLALIMFTIDLANQLREERITVNSLHPGTYLNTNMVRKANITPMGEPEIGADAEIYLATSTDMEGVTGKYLNIKVEAKANAQAYNQEARKKLREIGLKYTGLRQSI